MTTQTFVLREITAVDARPDTSVELFSLFAPDSPATHAAAEPWMSRLHRARGRGAVRDLGYWLRRRPAVLLRTFAIVVADHLVHPGVLLRAVWTMVLACQHARTVERLGIDHLHAHFATYPALAAWVVQRLVGTSFSVTPHAHDLYIHKAGLARKLRAASFVVGITHYNRGFIHAVAGPGVRAPLVRNGLDLEASTCRPRAPAPAGTVQAICIASFMPSKGQHVLVEALARGGPDVARLRMAFVGDGPQREQVQALALQRGVQSQVEFLGAQPQERVAQLLLDADLLVQPSLIAPNGDTEGLPTTLVEAMAAGVPVVATAVTGVPELVLDGTTGLLATPADAESLHAALERLLDDPPATLRRAERARALVGEQYVLERSATQLAELFALACPRAGEDQAAGFEQTNMSSPATIP